MALMNAEEAFKTVHGKVCDKACQQINNIMLRVQDSIAAQRYSFIVEHEEIDLIEDCLFEKDYYVEAINKDIRRIYFDYEHIQIVKEEKKNRIKEEVTKSPNVTIKLQVDMDKTNPTEQEIMDFTREAIQAAEDASGGACSLQVVSITTSSEY